MLSNFLEIEYGVKSNYLPHILFGNSLGKIHSIFNSSFNIIIHNKLVHFGSLGTPLSAFGINIPQKSLQLLLNHLQAGNFVQYNDNNLILDPDHQHFMIKLGMLSETDLRLNRLQIDWSHLNQHEIFKLISEIEFIRLSGVIHSAKDSSLLHELEAASVDDQKMIKKCIEHFFGRGIGLTPSGDDFISGLVMAESSFSNYSYWKDELRRYLQSHSTTDVSRSYYECLLDGYISENFKLLLSNLSRSVDAVKAKRLVNSVTNYGHTSGVDTLLGLMVALKQYTGANMLKENNQEN